MTEHHTPAHVRKATTSLIARPHLGRMARFALRYAAEKNLTQVAASLTFTTVLGIVPLLAVVLSLFTAFPLFAEFRIALEDFLAGNLMPPAVSANIMDYLNQFAAKASGLTAVGSMALIVTSILLIRTIDEAFNSIWQVEQQRPIRQRIWVYWAILSLGPILTGASLWASSLMAQQSVSYIERLPGTVGFALSIVPTLATGLGFTGLFMGVPNCRVHWKDALAGGMGTALVLSIMRTGFAYYLARFPSYTVIYGAFATLPIFLLWIYMSWLAILLGATVAATLPVLRQRQWDAHHYPGALLVDAVHVLAALWQTGRHTPPGRSLPALSEQTGLHPGELNRVLACLRELGYVVNSEDADRELWILARDPRTAQLGPLIRALLLDTNQPHLAADSALPMAVAMVLAGKDVRLETLFEHPETLPESLYIRQNGYRASQ